MSKKTTQEWFQEGVKEGASHMIVVCDTFEYEDYPVYIKPEEDFWKAYESYDEVNMQHIMEVYDLAKEFEEQFDGALRAKNTPPRQ